MPAGTPLRIPSGAQPRCAQRASQTLDVRGGSLELIGLQGVRLVVLPSCGGHKLCQRGFVRGAGLTVRGVLPILSYGDRAREPLGPPCRSTLGNATKEARAPIGV